MRTIKEKRLLIALLESKLERLTGKKIVYKEAKDDIDPDNIDWKRDSEKIAQYYPELLDPEKFNWRLHSWAIAKYCPEKLDPRRYNWEDDSWAVAQFCPEKLDPKRFNWEDEHSVNTLKIHAPDLYKKYKGIYFDE